MLPGITQGGDYIFYKVTSPTGYASGTVTASNGPVSAIVQTGGLPFVSFANSSGSYVIPAVAGIVNLAASVPNTALSGTASVQVTAGQTASANLSVVGQVESATVSPPNGAVGVPLTAEIDITAPEAFNLGPSLLQVRFSATNPVRTSTSLSSVLCTSGGRPRITKTR